MRQDDTDINKHSLNSYQRSILLTKQEELKCSFKNYIQNISTKKRRKIQNSASFNDLGCQIYLNPSICSFF